MRRFYLYILANKSNTLYTGMSNSLDRRVLEHYFKQNPNSFTAKYNINKLVYFEEFTNPNDAITAEKKVKGWNRKKKIELIKTKNPNFEDLFAQTS